MKKISLPGTVKSKGAGNECISITTWRMGVFCLICLFSSPYNAVGGDFSTTTSIEIRQTYNDNIFLVDENPEIRMKDSATGTREENTRTKSSDSITTISPGIGIDYESPRSSAEISARLNFLRYSDLNDLNDVNHFYRGLFKYQLTPYTRFTLDGSYVRDSDPGSETDITGLSYGTSVRHRQSYGAGLEFDLCELSLIQLNYSYGRDDFGDSSLASDNTYAQRLNREANNSKTHTLSLFYTRDISDILDRTFVYSNTRYLNYKTMRAEQDNVSTVMGAGYQLSETISLRAGAGVRYSHENFNSHQLRLIADPPFYELIEVERRQEQWAPVGHAQLEYNGEWTTARLQYSHDVQPASGEGTMTQLTEVRLDISRRFGEFFNIRGFSSYFFMKETINYMELMKKP